jgi:UDPglucose 6-dehydrogenase
MKIGVIGLGMVGEVLYRVFGKYYETKDYDKYKTSDKFEDLLDADAIFIAVPTPEGKDGRLDCSIVEEILEELEAAHYKGVIVIKSTVRIGFFDNMKSKESRIVYNPEFLHEKTRWEDFEHQFFVIFAGRSEDIEIAKKAYCWIPQERFEIVTFKEAELIKLTMNAFASTKISFWNEVRRICEQRDVDAGRIRNILRKDSKRWTDEYTDPFKGPYGGSCLPKDIRELINSSKKAILLKSVEKVNEEVKKESKKHK